MSYKPREHDLAIDTNFAEVDDIIHQTGVPNSPLFREACLSLGIDIHTDLTPKQFDDFNEQGIDPELQTIRAEHFETKRRERVKAVIRQRKHLFEENERRWHQMAIDNAENEETTKNLNINGGGIGSEPDNMDLDLNLISREQRQLEKIKIRQQQELEQMMAYEMKIAMMQKENDLKLEHERKRKEEQERLRKEKQMKWDQHRRQLELDRKEKEKYEEKERRRLAEKMFRVAKAQAEREKVAEKRRKKEAREKELERIKKKEDLNAQTQAILKEQQRQIELKKQEMAKRDVDRKLALEERRRKHAKEQAIKRKHQQDRVESAKLNHNYLLDKQREDFQERQRHVLDRQKRFQEEQARKLEHLRELALQKTEEIRRTKEQMEAIQKMKRDNIKKREQEINERMYQRELQKKKEMEITKKRQLHKNMSRKFAYDQMQKNLDTKKKKTMQNRAEKQAAADRHQKLRNRSNAIEEEKRRLRELDRVEALARKRRKDEYEKQKILKKIQDDNNRAKQLQLKKQALLDQRKEFRKKAELDRAKVLDQFEKMKSTGNFDPTFQAAISSSRSAIPIRNKNDNSMGSPGHFNDNKPKKKRPNSAKAVRSKPKSIDDSPRRSSSMFKLQRGNKVAPSPPKPKKLKSKRKRTKKKSTLSANLKTEISTKPPTRAEEESANNIRTVEVEKLRHKQNRELLAILEEEQQEEERREKIYQNATDPLEKSRLEKLFGVERAKASDRIMKTAAQHEAMLNQLMKSLNMMD